MNTNSTQQTVYNTYTSEELFEGTYEECQEYIGNYGGGYTALSIKPSTTPQQPDREKAAEWWDNLSHKSREVIKQKYSGKIKFEGVLEWAIEEYWRKETKSTTTDDQEKSDFEKAIESVVDNGGELKCTPGDWYKHDNMILTKGTPHNRIGLMYIRGSVDREFRQKVDEEMEANLDLCVASKDLYNALLEVSPLIDGLINRTPSGKQRDELCDMNIKVKTSLSKANVNYKP